LLTELSPTDLTKDDGDDNIVKEREDLVTNNKKRKTDTKTTKATPITTHQPPELIQAPESVGVAAMDDEHEICTASFNKSMKYPTLGNLQELHNILKSHFDHEEELIEMYSAKNGSSGTFSSLHSHRLDHECILMIITVELDRVFNPNTGGDESSGCSSLNQGAPS